MINVKQAVAASVGFLASIDNEAQDVLVEEVVYSSEIEAWLITLSFTYPNKKSNPLSVLAGDIRKYKIFRIDPDKGEVVSMKIRELAKTQ